MGWTRTTGETSCRDGFVSTAMRVRVTVAFDSVCGPIQNSASAGSIGPHLVIITRQWTLQADINSVRGFPYFVSDVWELSGQGRPLLPRQYEAVICLLPWLSAQAAVIQRSSTLCAYAICMHDFSRRTLAEGVVVSLKSMTRVRGTLRSRDAVRAWGR